MGTSTFSLFKIQFRQLISSEENVPKKMLSFIASRLSTFSVAKSCKFLLSNYVRVIILIFLTLHFLNLYFSQDSQQIYYGIHQGTRKVSLDERRIEQSEMRLRCMRKSWSPRPDTHPGAPIHSLPKGIPDLELTFHVHSLLKLNRSRSLEKNYKV